MQTTTLTIPEVILIGGTRAALGVGVGLLVSRKLSQAVRRGAGLTLLALGALTTIPLAMRIRAGRQTVS